jgi:hypothetical protein
MNAYILWRDAVLPQPSVPHCCLVCAHSLPFRCLLSPYWLPIPHGERQAAQSGALASTHYSDRLNRLQELHRYKHQQRALPM